QRGGEGLQILTQATGSYGSTAAASLGSASETVKEFRTNMEQAEGSAEELANTMRGSAAGAAAEMQARIADARAELGEELVPVMLDLYERILPGMVHQLGLFVDLLAALAEMDVPKVLAALDPAYQGWDDMTVLERLGTVLGGPFAPQRDPQFGRDLEAL